jgi:hypothetical protein
MSPLSPQNDSAQRLAVLKEEAAREFAERAARRASPVSTPEPRPLRRVGSETGFLVLTVAALVALPFVLLVRGSVYLYAQRGLPSWLALVISGFATLVVITAYGAWLLRRFTGRARLRFVARWVALPLLVGFCGHALLYLERTHAKDDTIRTEYRATHPLLRIALSTLVLANHDLVITDASRTPVDYLRMGLPVFDGTLHYPQRDGWVHAVDLRTKGRNPAVNWLVERYFRAMGFCTLRHVGTADHLHVELPVN